MHSLKEIFVISPFATIDAVNTINFLDVIITIITVASVIICNRFAVTGGIESMPPRFRRNSRPVDGRCTVHVSCCPQPPEEECAGIFKELNVEQVELGELAHLFRGDIGLARVRIIVLDKVFGEADAERVPEEVTGLGLVLGEAEECHAAKVVLGTLEHDAVALCPVGHHARVVAADEVEACEHPCLSVVGEVVWARHELIKRYAGPVVSYNGANQT